MQLKWRRYYASGFYASRWFLLYEGIAGFICLHPSLRTIRQPDPVCGWVPIRCECLITQNEGNHVGEERAARNQGNNAQRQKTCTTNKKVIDIWFFLEYSTLTTTAKEKQVTPLRGTAYPPPSPWSCSCTFTASLFTVWHTGKGFN